MNITQNFPLEPMRTVRTERYAMMLREKGIWKYLAPFLW